MRTTQLYTHTSTHASVVIKLIKPHIGELLRFLESELSEYEQIDIEQWTGTWFYLVIRDMRGKDIPHSGVSRMRAGITVDLADDTIMWSDDKMKNGSSGGNCFVRSPKWKTILRRHFNLGHNHIWRSKFHVYKDDFFRLIKKPAHPFSGIQALGKDTGATFRAERK